MNSPGNTDLDVLVGALAGGRDGEVRAALLSTHVLREPLLQIFADLLGTDSVYGDIVPQRLKLVKRGRGRPKQSAGLPAKAEQLSAVEQFFLAIRTGRQSEAAKALREANVIKGPQLRLFASLFDNDQKLPSSFGWRLQLVGLRRGRAADKLQTGAALSGWRRAIDLATAKHPPGTKMEAVVQEVMTSTANTRPTVKAWMRRVKSAANKIDN